MRHASRYPRHPSAAGRAIPSRSASSRPASSVPPTVRSASLMTAPRATVIARPGHDQACRTAEAGSPARRVLSPPAPGPPSQRRPLVRMQRQAAGTRCPTSTTGPSSPPTSRRSVQTCQGQLRQGQGQRQRVRMARRAAPARPSQPAGRPPLADPRNAPIRGPCQLGRCLPVLSPLVRCQFGHGRSPVAPGALRPLGAPQTSPRRSSLMYVRPGRPGTAASRPRKTWRR
jgi:hypothetical protein